MRRVLPALALAAAATAAVAGCSASHPAPRPPASYYLSLGDSLSQGVQPNPAGDSVPTPQGYADQLYAALRRQKPGLRLVKLGCPGETTGTMITGGICSYPGGSQLAAAVTFLRAHQGRVWLITIDIGGNDPSSCITRPSLRTLASCLGKLVPDTNANLTKIMAGLSEAADGARIVGMNYYLPALSEWLSGPAGQALARVSARLAAAYNGVLADVYKASGAEVADVFGAFHSTDFGHEVTVAGFGRLPRNVAAICQWTWQCAQPPRGPNQHANQAGYAVIARTFMPAARR